MLCRRHCSSSMQNPKPSTRIAKAQSPAAIRRCIFLHLLPVTPPLVWCFPNAPAQHGIVRCQNKKCTKVIRWQLRCSTKCSTNSVSVYASYVHQHLYRYITLTHNAISLCTAGRQQRGTSYHCCLLLWCCSSVAAVQDCGAVLASAVHAETELQDALLVLLLFGAAALLQNAKQQHARVRGSVLHSWMLYTPHVEMH
ncbi:hypothetical protein COO60DRAFT_1018603 [Scenedesmus sp. NREL 46B-D3]|nr:hypothetical protein COO60DRAFT_1018603 [Scenedesmus sp. NREL 46B-D3]